VRRHARDERCWLHAERFCLSRSDIAGGEAIAVQECEA
jgi:hypothetical protein